MSLEKINWQPLLFLKHFRYRFEQVKKEVMSDIQRKLFKSKSRMQFGYHGFFGCCFGFRHVLPLQKTEQTHCTKNEVLIKNFFSKCD